MSSFNNRSVLDRVFQEEGKASELESESEVLNKREGAEIAKKCNT